MIRMVSSSFRSTWNPPRHEKQALPPKEGNGGRTRRCGYGDRGDGVPWGDPALGTWLFRPLYAFWGPSRAPQETVRIWFPPCNSWDMEPQYPEHKPLCGPSAHPIQLGSVSPCSLCLTRKTPAAGMLLCTSNTDWSAHRPTTHQAHASSAAGASLTTWGLHRVILREGSHSAWVEPGERNPDLPRRLLLY